MSACRDDLHGGCCWVLFDLVSISSYTNVYSEWPLVLVAPLPGDSQDLVRGYTYPNWGHKSW